MKTKVYNKLVRDRIPEIIEASGKSCTCEMLPDEQYIELLNKKLQEEVAEYLESGTVEELADIGEVMHAILDYSAFSTYRHRVRIGCLIGTFLHRLFYVSMLTESYQIGWSVPVKLLAAVIAVTFLMVYISVLAPIKKISRMDIIEAVNVQ